MNAPSELTRCVSHTSSARMGIRIRGTGFMERRVGFRSRSLISRRGHVARRHQPRILCREHRRRPRTAASEVPPL
jgi:hypothetical protein